MSNQKKPDEMTVIREEVHSLIKIVRDLEQAFPGRHFTLDGHLLGSIGEVLAVYYYGIELLSIPGLVTPVSGPSETSIPGNRKP